MNVYINGNPAVLAENETFTYFEESILFEDAAGYTLDMTFPLKGCEINRRIFGYIDRNPPKSAKWGCRISCGKLSRSGTALLTDIVDGTVKIQFVAGAASVSNSERLDKLYINELPLPANRIERFDNITPSLLISEYTYQGSGDFKNKLPETTSGGDVYNYMAMRAVALPWINTETGIEQNGFNGSSYTPNVMACGVSFMPYLVSLTGAILQRAGFSCNLQEWENSKYRNLILCNAVPMERRNQFEYDFKKALPHWTVAEYLSELEPLLGGEFEIDRNQAYVTFRFSGKAFEARKVVKLDKIDDETQITSDYGLEETEGKYRISKPFRYASQDGEQWKFADCPWYIATLASGFNHRYSDVSKALEYMRGVKDRYDMHARVFTAEEENISLCFRNEATVISKNDKYEITNGIIPQVINEFGPAEFDNKKDTDYKELRAVPVMTSRTRIQLSPGGAFDAIADILSGGPGVDLSGMLPTTQTSEAESEADAEEGAYQTPVIDALENGESEKESAFYSLLHIGYWPGRTASKGDFSYLPQTRGFNVTTGFEIIADDFSMRLNADTRKAFLSSYYRDLPKIDESVKYQFTFYSNEFPDVNAEFNIKGHRYVCKRMEASFTRRGMSPRMKGDFYRIVDDE